MNSDNNEHKLTILMVEDEGFSVCADSLPNMVPGTIDFEYDPAVSDTLYEHLQRCFSVNNLMTIQELKKYFVSMLEVREDTPSIVAPNQLLPELVFFDYCLLRGSEKFKEDRPTNITRRIPSRFVLKNVSLPPWIQMDNTDDRSGLLLGSAIPLVFSDYPLVGIPTTVHTHSPGELGIFEWYTDSALKSSYQLKNNHRNWPDLLRHGLPNLRDRLAELHGKRSRFKNTGLLVEVLDCLKTDHDSSVAEILEGEMLVIDTGYYGERTIMLESIFFDTLYLNENFTPAKQRKKVIDWLEKVVWSGFPVLLKGGLSVSKSLYEKVSIEALNAYAHFNKQLSILQNQKDNAKSLSNFNYTLGRFDMPTIPWGRNKTAGLMGFNDLNDADKKAAHRLFLLLGYVAFSNVKHGHSDFYHFKNFQFFIGATEEAHSRYLRRQDISMDKVFKQEGWEQGEIKLAEYFASHHGFSSPLTE